MVKNQFDSQKRKILGNRVESRARGIVDASQVGETYLVGPQAHSADKAKTFGWRTIGSPPAMMMIHKSKLLIDPSYQREASASAVNALCRDWNWYAAGAILVAKRPDGSLAVFDGQHRVLAARNTSLVQDLPCLVFDMAGASEEAMAFVNANIRRRPVSAHSKFRAAIVGEDPGAVAISQVLADAGLEANPEPKNPRQIRGIDTIYKVVADIGEDMAVEVLSALRSAAESSGEPIGYQSVIGLAYIAKKFPLVLRNKRFLTRLAAVGTSTINSQIKKARIKSERALTPRALAQIIIDEVNLRLHAQSRFSIDGSGA